MVVKNEPVLDSTPDFTQQARIERYKFILTELARLSENSHKHTRYLLTIFPAFTSAIIVLKFGENKIGSSVNIASPIAIAFLVVFTLASLFVIVSILADTATWFDYRNEEVKLVRLMGGDFRKQPKLGNFWRWYETYLIAFITFFLVGAWCIYLFLFDDKSLVLPTFSCVR